MKEIIDNYDVVYIYIQLNMNDRKTEKLTFFYIINSIASARHAPNNSYCPQFINAL